MATSLWQQLSGYVGAGGAGGADDADGDYEEYYDEENYEIACVKHKHAMRRLMDAFPELSSDECHRRPCPCGRGALAMWPWVQKTAALG